jgi:hypothetical protein
VDAGDDGDEPAMLAAGDDAIVLAAVRTVAGQRPPNDLLPVRTVRTWASELDKPRFDAAALRLFAAEKVILHHHDFPESLAPRARDELVLDAKGTYYVGIAPREAPTSRALPLKDSDFAKLVLAAARASKTGRFGSNKVFISHVLRQLAAEGYAVGDAEAVKARLVAAHRAGLLSLARADLVEAMAPGDVDASETRHGSATFHFVRLPEDR